MTPRVSVCIASFNGAPHIKAQVESILVQLSEGDEVIICDDCSTDGTLSIIDEIADGRILTFRNEENLGVYKNFERCLNLASGDVIFLSDQDDVWMPNKVNAMMARLEAYDFVVSDALVVNQNMDASLGSYLRFRGYGLGLWQNFIKMRHLGCCFAFRRSVLNAVLPFPRESHLVTHDYWILLCSLALFRNCYIDEALILYRRHDGNFSAGGHESGNSYWTMLLIRFNILWHILSRLPWQLLKK